MSVSYSTRTQSPKLRMRTIFLVGVYCKICKNRLHESWYANNQSCIFLSLHTATFLDFQNKNILYFLHICLRPLSLRLLVATVLKFLKHNKARINFYSKLSGSSVCIVQFTYRLTHIMCTNSFRFCLSCFLVNDWLYEWLIDWLTDWLTDWWMGGWMIRWAND